MYLPRSICLRPECKRGSSLREGYKLCLRRKRWRHRRGYSGLKIYPRRSIKCISTPMEQRFKSQLDQETKRGQVFCYLKLPAVPLIFQGYVQSIDSWPCPCFGIVVWDKEVSHLFLVKKRPGTSCTAVFSSPRLQILSTSIHYYSF